MRVIDRTGQRYGRLLVIERAPKPPERKDSFAYWLCRCDCTRTTIVSSGDLSTGNTQSCGCGEKVFEPTRGGHTSHPMWGAWNAMHRRCKDPNHSGYYKYGARGITVDPRWDDFETFLADMGERPEGMTLGRINNDGHYGPQNCRWETDEEQLNNTRRNRFITAFGKTQTVAQWARETGLPDGVIRNRLRYGWPPEDILKPQMRVADRHKAFGRKQTLLEWAKEFNIPYQRLRGRVENMGWSLEKALTTPPNQRSRAKGK